ncbi:MAG: NnrU family protein [Betaproteobacteria bacterium]|nr:NnrU family protein [Betaproteobacteria bacterium]
MALLIAGLILFLGAHSTRVFADDWRTSMLERLGEKKWKGLITLLSIAGFVLLILGYDQARMTTVALWQPPLWARHLAIVLNLLAFVLLAAAYVPRNSIKAKIGHPMIAGVKIWALAHLLANGTLVDVLLFGTFLIWAVLDFRTSRRRDRMNATTYPSGALANTLLTLVVGLGAGAVFMLWLHARWVGVSPLGM